MAKDSTSPLTGTPSEATKHLQATILDMKRDGKSFLQIAKELDYSDTYIKKLYRKALKDIIVDKVEDVRKMEIARLDKLWAEAVAILDTQHLMVNSGQVVRDIEEGAEGEEPVITKLQDHGPRLQAINQALKIMDRRARLLGLDAPTKVAPTDPKGDKPYSSVLIIPATPADEAL